MGLFSLADQVVQDDARKAAQAAGLTSGAANQPTPSEPPAAVGLALKRLVDFIPTETVTLFWLAIPAAQSLATYLAADGKTPPGPTWIDWAMFLLLLGLTPVLLLLTYLSGLASKDLPRPKVGEWPWWKALASTIAFTVWAFAVPGNPYMG